MSQHHIRLGDLVLSDGADPGAAGADYAYSIVGENFETGEPEPIEVTIRTFLQDGARVMTQGYGNREVRFRVIISGYNSACLARGEEALAVQMGIRNELGITPPDGWAPESVFDVETSSFGHDVDDLLEVNSNERVYSLRFVCQPFVRTAEPVVVPAVAVAAVTPVVTTIDAGTAVTRWTARIGALSDQGAFLRVSGTKTPRAVWTGSTAFDLTGRHFVSIDVIAKSKAPTLTADGVPAPRVASISGLVAGYTRHTFTVAANSVASMEFAVDFAASGDNLDFTNLTASNVAPYSGTTRQSTRTVTVAGSARTQGSLALEATTGTLGSVLVYTTTSEGLGSPSLRPYRVSGGSQTADAGAVSSTTENSAAVYQVPVADLARGKHQLFVRIKAPSTAPITVPWSARVKTSAGYAGPIVSGTTTVTPSASGFGVFAVTNIDLPTVDVPDESSAVVELTLGGGFVVFDDWWLFNLDVGALTWVEAGLMTQAWIETANLSRPSPAVYLGTAADRSDAHGAYDTLRSWGTHTFKATTTVFVVTSASAATEVSFEYFPRYFNFVPGD